MLVDPAGDVSQVWMTVDARTFPAECLKGLPEPADPVWAYGPKYVNPPLSDNPPTALDQKEAKK